MIRLPFFDCLLCVIQGGRYLMNIDSLNFHNNFLKLHLCAVAHVMDVFVEINWTEKESKAN